MKKLMLSLTVAAAVALTPALLAGGECCAKAAAANKDKGAAATCTQTVKGEAKAACPLQAKDAQVKNASTKNGSCCPATGAKTTTTAKKAQSPKAGTFVQK